MSAIGARWKGMGPVLGIVAALLVLRAPSQIYKGANDAGYVSHSKITPVLTQSNWMVGEYRDCDVWWVQADGSIEALRCPTDAPLYTDARNEHDLRVKYWGRTVRKDYIGTQASYDGKSGPMWLWRCQRRANGLTCWAVN